MKIIITGASGQLGSMIIERLLQTMPASQIVACVRRMESGSEWESQGIEVRCCDYDHPESLVKAFEGAAKLLLISSPHHDDTVRIRQHAHAVEAAKQANVGHLLYTGFAFAEKGSLSMTHLHLATEHAIMTTGIPYTLLRSGLYSDFIGSLGLQEALDTGELAVLPGDWAFNSVTRRDLADAAAAVLTGGDHQNRTYELSAAATWSFEDLAETLSELAGRPVSLTRNPEIRNWVYGFLSKIDTISTSGDLERLLGRPVASLKESVRPLFPLNEEE
ncbi:NmrA family NAD(P)-binding protein [Paenibacillus sp. HN-1]|uniref:NmrA family NAD(P)-binding protein n=1 Tax=Paenibacillus TaxID=44249 RepID=UPI001CA8CFD1|nr:MULTISPECIES: NmrA family NAD(P)-binding protein [Paenibacillus]MBY9080294.1 NmrA family NAD(P)-binding protein [Paenibacillus sp. CGMCC 1.18879]MBY9083047.1 NmrA family NAD(P)-binding protein [Paenibacillus sinensis]